MLVWGHGRKVEPIAQLIALDECPACSNRTVLQLGVLKKDFRLYWIPVARWDSSFFVFCPICQGSFEVEKQLGQRVRAQLKQGIQLTDAQVGELLGVKPASLPPRTNSASARPTHQSTSPGPSQVLLLCKACGRKNRVPAASLRAARCGSCSASLAS